MATQTNKLDKVSLPKLGRRKEDAVEVEELQSGMCNSANKESDSVQIQESASAATKASDSKPPASDQEVVPAVVQRATGPRTSASKEKSKYNAIKHGIFSKIVLLRGESGLEFNSLLNGLRNDFRPEGTLEEILVEKLASLVWRHRRMLIAEGAEIQRGVQFYSWYKSERDEKEAAIFLRSEEKIRAGLIWRLDNPFIRKRCIEILQCLKEAIEIRGFDSSLDRHFLALVYGDAEMTGPRDSLVLSYLIYSHRGEYPDIKELQNLATPERRKAAFLEDLQHVIDRLEGYSEVAARFSAPRQKLESLCRKVPDAPELDRLLRCEASLDRSFHRTLSELDSRQRMRLGQPVLPTVEVRHSMS
jgi:hypothetical protein